jgi:hypothetical protein
MDRLDAVSVWSVESGLDGILGQIMCLLLVPLILMTFNIHTFMWGNVKCHKFGL